MLQTVLSIATKTNQPTYLRMVESSYNTKALATCPNFAQQLGADECLMSFFFKHRHQTQRLLQQTSLYGSQGTVTKHHIFFPRRICFVLTADLKVPYCHSEAEKLCGSQPRKSWISRLPFMSLLAKCRFVS